MLDDATSPLVKLRDSEAQKLFWRDAMRFFEWWGEEKNRRPVLEKLDAQPRREFESGKTPEHLLKEVRTKWSSHLKHTLPWSEQRAVLHQVLTNPRDLAAVMDSYPWQWYRLPRGIRAAAATDAIVPGFEWLHDLPPEKRAAIAKGRLRVLPKRIRTAVTNGEKKRAQEIHDTFFSYDAEARIADYLQVWRSQDRASHIIFLLRMKVLTIDELDRKTNATGRISMGGIPFDQKRWAIWHVERGGTLKQCGVPETIFRAAQDDDQQFLTHLVRALDRTHKTNQRRLEVNWDDVNKVACFLVDNWCGTWDDRFPPLCLFQNKALATFCALALGKEQKDTVTSADNVRKWVSRLRLKRAKQPKVALEIDNDRINFVRV